MISKIRYRLWQFWQSLKRPPDIIEWKKVGNLLSPQELILFQRLPIPDQNHSLRVLKSLQAAGETDLDLQKSALLHDIGKSLHPLDRWERVFAVLILGLLPGKAREWGKLEPRGLHRALAVIHQHPAWGAEMLREAGSSQRVIDLVRFHERQEITGLLDQGGLELLQKLQNADDLN